MEFYQAMANPSHDMKKEAAKLNSVQDQESSIIEVKKSLRYLVTKMKDQSSKGRHSINYLCLSRRTSSFLRMVLILPCLETSRPFLV